MDEPSAFNSYQPPERRAESFGQVAEVIFGVTYILIFIGCIVAAGSAGEWTGVSIAFGVVWGMLCLPGWIVIFSFILVIRDKLKGVNRDSKR